MPKKRTHSFSILFPFSNWPRDFPAKCPIFENLEMSYSKYSNFLNSKLRHFEDLEPWKEGHFEKKHVTIVLRNEKKSLKMKSINFGAFRRKNVHATKWQNLPSHTHVYCDCLKIKNGITSLWINEFQFWKNGNNNSSAQYFFSKKYATFDNSYNPFL